MNDTTSTPAMGSTVLGYPRIGPAREIKFALERYWSGTIDRAALEEAGRTERRRTWEELRDAGLDSIPSGTFSFYDHVLDTAVLLGAVPERHRAVHEQDPLDGYFAMARGTAQVAPLEMTKWFDTNYHYLVPEIGPDTAFRLDATRILSELAEAAQLGIATRPVLLGPVSFLLLAKADAEAPGGFSPLDRLGDLLPLYADLLAQLRGAGTTWVQLDEPALVQDRTTAELEATGTAYRTIGDLSDRPSLFVASYFGHLGEALPVLADTAVEAIGVDLCSGTTVDQLAAVPALRHKTLVAGVVDGRNIWRTDLRVALDTLERLRTVAGTVATSTSASLLHVPYSLEHEDALDPELRSWLAFSHEKVLAVVALQRGLDEGEAAVAAEVQAAGAALTSRAESPLTAIPSVRARVAGLTESDRSRGEFSDRAAAQAERLGLPVLPTTTIGSFPQTREIRSARADHRAGRIDTEAYTAVMKAEIERVIALQESLGLDVLVHGEPERNDMVQYFAELLDGFATSAHGWVQSYGSRCVRPPILYGDVRRPAPMTVPWASYAQSLTDRPVKGMLTGPVTILAWSFVRDDQPLAETALQVALAVRDETVDLEDAGIAIIQVDEPALRELLPLRAGEQPAYLSWAVDAFRVATGALADSTQVHTHLCYSEFGEVVGAIDALDADVTSLEAARSRMEVLPALTRGGMNRGVGPGVYDIHSPRVPDVEEIKALLTRASGSVPVSRLWVNPDCGLKTRGYEEAEAALNNLVVAATALRKSLPSV
ncbi:5-methyltetrahydropteroyltriglutamate--homocysteine S-methyltransferase [Segeticoccus rhizosphaerae]|uniref:5-methyltetrahydropteroyltriglutamate-- homocysteine S-methyltransferase n=1 Tax=Segeticoccus rhizosphaerae TaxID=1104777 RepID=UPI00359F217B